MAAAIHSPVLFYIKEEHKVFDALCMHVVASNYVKVGMSFNIGERHQTDENKAHLGAVAIPLLPRPSYEQESVSNKEAVRLEIQGHLFSGNMQTERCLHITQGRSCYSSSTLDGLCSAAPLDLHDTHRIRHTAWKSRIHDFMQSPLLWRKTYRPATNQTSLLGESLETLLSHKRGQIAFRDFLKSEFCEENLDFWLACQEYKTHGSPETLQWRAKNIYEEFITAESPKQVNLDFSTRDAISQSLRQPTASCFVAAQKKIYSLMENGSFQRFIHSEQYKVLSDAALKHKGLGKHRKALKTKSTGDLSQTDSKPVFLQSDLHPLHRD